MSEEFPADPLPARIPRDREDTELHGAWSTNPKVLLAVLAGLRRNLGWDDDNRPNRRGDDQE